MLVAVPSCLTFDRDCVFFAAVFAWAKTGKRIAARIAMIAITTNNSISVNAFLIGFLVLSLGSGANRVSVSALIESDS